ncbi:hypothetical protein LX15_002900 [Streptoalloteichus tenebrarius]|uniref:Uncharacterized protein n=2 Tax=Streptoalloteichus tenebrarius (strain ATCC 17920 / DSM 40477 / JCM 4838 / CBS 697.72 / NBRC 16177 / NCIMB 11028 / NRRL B-12390 / A12253. 1 / ISP 5477) TaxID=1933 RepID=A0ABT1HUK5_STRSD|nr:hypothetical protein [Streptoalloteichus tenebrarius]BFF04320.1 hypothetical protein GCM10020241_59950 [Streptoalloteichus tenebrarius]
MAGEAVSSVQTRDVHGGIHIHVESGRPRRRRSRRLPRRWLALAVGLALAAGLIAASQLRRGEDPGRGPMVVDGRGGFVWAHDPTASRYRPVAQKSMYVYNSADAADVEIVREGVGEYAVRFGGLGVAGGVAHASAYGPTSDFCVVAGLAEEGMTEVVRVRCFDTGGAPVDVRFVASFAHRSVGDGRFSYLWAEPRNERYRPGDPATRYDSTGGVAWVERRSAGQYLVHVPASAGVPTAKQFYQVTARGDGPAHCKLAAPPAPSGVQQVTCRDVRGEPVDHAFLLSFSAGSSVIGRTDRHFGNASSAVDADVMRVETGYYRVRSREMGSPSGHATASALGESDAYCHVENWVPDGADLVSDVRCFSASAHSPTDAAFFIGTSW